MKIEDLHVHIQDAGSFLPLAQMFSKVARKTTYYSPMDQEFLGIERCVIGDGFDGFEREDEYLDPDFIKSVQLWVFPDQGYGGFQRYLRSIGKLVWGSMGASELELYRTRFLKVLNEVGLPVVHSVAIRGLTKLAEHLKSVENKWVKINRYRDNMETWHHQDYDHSERELERLSLCFGPLKEHVTFVVQDAIDGTPDEPVIEAGYDGWCIERDGVAQFPKTSFQGVEKKNQLYLGSQLDYDELPEQIKIVNEKFGKALAEYQYRNFFATEIRIKGDEFSFIDPTCRMAGMTQEHLIKTCTNLPDVILAGAQGNVINPEFENPFAAEATIHYKSANETEGWKTFKMSDEASEFVKLYRCCYADGVYHFPPHHSDELGVVIGNGPTPEDAIENMKDHFEMISDEPVSIELSGFADLIEDIEKAQEHGVPFSDKPMPDPADVALK